MSEELARLIEEQQEDDRFGRRVRSLSLDAPLFVGADGNPVYAREEPLYLPHGHLIEWRDPTGDLALGIRHDPAKTLWGRPRARHGTRWAYEHYGCRCLECRRANASHARARYRPEGRELDEDRSRSARVTPDKSIVDRAEFVALLEKGKTVDQALQRLGRTKWWFYKWTKRDSDFAAMVKALS